MVPLAMEENVRLGPLQVDQLGAEAIRVVANEVAPLAKPSGAADDLIRAEKERRLAVACPRGVHLCNLPLMSLMWHRY